MKTTFTVLAMATPFGCGCGRRRLLFFATSVEVTASAAPADAVVDDCCCCKSGASDSGSTVGIVVIGLVHDQHAQVNVVALSPRAVSCGEVRTTHTHSFIHPHNLYNLYACTVHGSLQSCSVRHNFKKTKKRVGQKIDFFFLLTR